MTRAEEAALKAYPHKIEEHPKVMGGSITFDANSQPRAFYKQGYEQAEKDFALTWEDIAMIDAIILDTNNEFAIDSSKKISRQRFYEEVLKRFLEQRKK